MERFTFRYDTLDREWVFARRNKEVSGSPIAKGWLEFIFLSSYKSIEVVEVQSTGDILFRQLGLYHNFANLPDI